MVELEQVRGFSRIARRFLTPSSTTTLVGASAPSQTGWYSTFVKDLSVAQEMLDRLEREGHAELQLHILANTRFEVCWK